MNSLEKEDKTDHFYTFTEEDISKGKSYGEIMIKPSLVLYIIKIALKRATYN